MGTTCSKTLCPRSLGSHPTRIFVLSDPKWPMFLQQGWQAWDTCVVLSRARQPRSALGLGCSESFPCIMDFKWFCCGFPHPLSWNLSQSNQRDAPQSWKQKHNNLNDVGFVSDHFFFPFSLKSMVAFQTCSVCFYISENASVSLEAGTVLILVGWSDTKGSVCLSETLPLSLQPHLWAKPKPQPSAESENQSLSPERWRLHLKHHWIYPEDTVRVLCARMYAITWLITCCEKFQTAQRFYGKGPTAKKCMQLPQDGIWNNEIHSQKLFGDYEKCSCYMNRRGEKQDTNFWIKDYVSFVLYRHLWVTETLAGDTGRRQTGKAGLPETLIFLSIIACIFQNVYKDVNFFCNEKKGHIFISK